MSRYHRLLEYSKKELESSRVFLEKYYSQSEPGKLVQVDEHTDKSKYYLLYNGSHYGWEHRRFKPDRFKLDGIIQLPRSLYILENMYFGNGCVIEDYSFENYLDFFYFNEKPKEVYDFEKIESLQAFGLIDNTLSNERLKNNSKLVKKLKDYKEDCN